MKSRRKAVLGGALLLAAMATVVGGIVLWLYPPLPAPELANRKQLLCWVLMRDLSTEPMAIRLALVRRFEEEFREPPDFSKVSHRCEDACRRLAHDNVLILLETWFVDKAEAYAGLKPDQQNAFLDRLLDQIDAWRTAAMASDSSAADPIVSPESLSASAVLGLIQQWRERADGRQQTAIDAFLVAIQMRWLVRQTLPASLWPK